MLRRHFVTGHARVLASLVTLATIAAATAATASAPQRTPSYVHPWFEIGGYHNSRDEDSTGTTGTNRGEATIFAPIRGGHRTLMFSQVTAKFFDDTAKEGNLAFGYRQMTPWGFNLGAWVGGDVRRTEIDNTFWQLSGGFEALSKNVDMRLNWYGPVTAPQTGVAGFAQVQLQGNQIFMTGGEEVGLKGIDGEIGFRLPTEYLTINPDLFELRAYAGGYHFYSDDALDNVTGVKGRLELRVNDVIPSVPGSRLTVDYEVSHDDVRDTRHDVGLRMRIPLNGGKPVRSLASLSHQQRRMLDGIERDTDIVTGRSKRENVGDALTNTNFDRVAYANATTDVTDASAAAGDNSLIIVNGEVQGAQTLQGNQTLQGGGSTISVRGLRSGLVLPFTAPGATGSLTTPDPSDFENLLVNGSNTHVAGITIDGGYGSGGNGYGIHIGDNRTNIYLTNFQVSNTGQPGIYIGDDNVVEIAGGQLSDVGLDGTDGVEVQSDNVIVVRDTTVSNPNSDGLNFFNNNTIVLQNVHISRDDSGDDAVQVGANTTLSILNSAISGGFNNGLRGSFTELTVLDSQFSNIGSSVFLISGGQLQFSRNTFSGTIGDSIFEFSNSPTVLGGSTGNINNATLGGPVCDGNFTGEIGLDGTLLTSASC